MFIKWANQSGIILPSGKLDIKEVPWTEEIYKSIIEEKRVKQIKEYLKTIIKDNMFTIETYPFDMEERNLYKMTIIGVLNGIGKVKEILYDGIKVVSSRYLNDMYKEYGDDLRAFKTIIPLGANTYRLAKIDICTEFGGVIDMI